jgi:hypothetical protein
LRPFTFLEVAMLLHRVGLTRYAGSLSEYHRVLGCVMRETTRPDRFIMRLWNGVILREVRPGSIDWYAAESMAVDGELDCRCGVSHPPMFPARPDYI